MSNNKQQPKPENPNNQFSNTEPLTHAQRVAIANKMSNNKQSSVEWLAGMIIKMGYVSTEILEEAKAKHYEECKESYYESLLSNFQTFEHYYEQTFGGNNEQQ